MKAYIQNSILVVFSFLLTLLLIEGITRCFNSHHSLYNQRIGMREWLQSKPKAYKNEPYIVELAKNYQQTDKIVAPNTENKLRPTCFQENTFAHTIYVFGGSTIYGFMATDCLTIPSHLQKLFNHKIPNTYKIVNMGALGLTTTMQVEQLKKINLQAQDIVLFYDGLNDVIKHFVQDKQENKDKKATKLQEYIQLFMLKIYQRFAKFSVFVDWQFYPYKTQDLLAYWEDSKQVENILADFKRTYFQNIITASQICKAKNIRFYHFLQPILYTYPNEKFSDYQLFMASNMHLSGGKNTAKACIFAYPYVQNWQKELQKQGIYSVDLSQSLHTINEEVFWDFCHLSGFGNEIMANKIFERLQ
jgi:hypothetical protein